MKTKKIEIIKQTHWRGVLLQPGDILDMVLPDADHYISQGNAKELITPENRIYK
jgi:hypothetical protein